MISSRGCADYEGERWDTGLVITMTFPMADVDPNTVRPGWVALLIVLALGGATVLLWRNMSKQLKKIDFGPGEGVDVPPEPAETDDPPSAARPKGDTDHRVHTPGNQLADPQRAKRRPPV
jgi:hypothetical protein